MNHILFKGILLSLCLCFSWPDKAHSQELAGWSELEDAISEAPVSNLEILRGREFFLSHPEHAISDLEVSPETAFEIAKTDGGFLLTIVNPKPLTSYDGVFYRRVAISWKIVVRGGSEFDISISGINECIFNFTFSQDGGDTLNLSQVAQSYDIGVSYSDPDVIDTTIFNGASLLVTRQPNNNEDVNLRLTIKNDAGSTRSERIPVPKCTSYEDEAGYTIENEQVIAPQCVRLLDTDTEVGSRRLDQNFTFANTCSRAVSCDITYRYLRARDRQSYEYAFDNVLEDYPRRNGAITLREVQDKFLRIPAKDTRDVHVVWRDDDFSFKEGHYVIWEPVSPRDVLIGEGHPYFICEFD